MYWMNWYCIKFEIQERGSIEKMIWKDKKSIDESKGEKPQIPIYIPHIDNVYSNSMWGHS